MGSPLESLVDGLHEGFDAVDALFGIDSRVSAKAAGAPAAVGTCAPGTLRPAVVRRLPAVASVADINVTDVIDVTDVNPAEREVARR